ncbi:BMP family ABC transporter substrate-binding protein [Lampropedia puyangensis]|uniref:BMP family ABC transporter substrate-binding protein n=1 Tax=Lampropedia puyangensis TaxID=1330072 RepID=A0A4S8F0A7_9BURK|nr:BMP family ABC transporter substrate-binding protein [Lampropedia puyangensis]THT99664.1 BMP family ABC transporter substrate-binding protein [Lampropedia puyangensis]
MAATQAEVVLFGPPGQGGFNGAALDGVARAQALGHAAQVHWVQGDAAARAAQLRQIALDAHGVVVLHGGQGVAPLTAVLADVSHVPFAITQGHVQAPNVAGYEVLQEHSAFLAGVLAAHTTRSAKVAHLSGEKVLPGLKGRAAFLHGYQTAGGRDYVTTFTGDQHDAALTERYADALFASGADVVFAMIDGGRAGLVRACARWGAAHIGNVFDWVERSPGQFLASAVADSGRLVQQAIEDYANDNLPLGQQVRVGLEQPQWVRLALASSVAPPAREAIDYWHAQITSGALQVQTDWQGDELLLD